MKRALRLFAILLLTGAVYAADFTTEFEKVKARKDVAATEKFLAEQYETNKTNPEYFIAAANFWWNLGLEVNISTKPAAPGGIQITEQGTGKAVGSIGTLGEANPDIPRKAVKLLTEATQKFPQRADIWMGLAYLQHELKEEDDCLKTLDAFLDQVAEKKLRFTWKKNGPFPQPMERFIPESVQTYSGAFYRAASKDGDLRCRELCEHLIKAFPDHPYAYNNLAALSHAQNDEAASLRYLLLASSKDPKDALVLMNIGDAYSRAGDKAKAREYFEKALKYGDDETKADAKKSLARLKAAPKS
jgi:tetratricopeptide (TPR) repeat protein